MPLERGQLGNQVGHNSLHGGVEPYSLKQHWIRDSMNNTATRLVGSKQLGSQGLLANQWQGDKNGTKFETVAFTSLPMRNELEVQPFQKSARGGKQSKGVAPHVVRSTARQPASCCWATEQS
ncbi:hypothetical protein Y1Q_0016984 [Alligator mississippiensis]|uniref:Uncharacterized protein n=1 Tax=Alligator mississippiensis TaxID=8496 RepID=A0A151N3B9_ALLMI|nr:hypothetical protein Y1Q_0016984 [Alligator mississippiensis]